MNSTVTGIRELVTLQMSNALALSSSEVLVVDDDPATLELVKRILESSGYQVQVARDGEEAIEMIRTSPPDFLLTDWDMPQVDGIELCNWVRRESFPKYIYTILITGHTETKHMVQAISSGADDFFSKPIRPGELLSRMQAGLRLLESERQLRLLAKSDPLTGLLNRRSFFELLQQQWARSLRNNTPISCVMIDVDHFKAVNDSYGHLVGDDVLQMIARTLKDCCRESDHVCRYGGEEFCVLLLDSGEEEALRWSERCRTTLADTAAETKAGIVKVTASFGVAGRVATTESPEEFVDMADQALLVAKTSGRNRLVSWSSLKS